MFSGSASTSTQVQASAGALAGSGSTSAAGWYRCPHRLRCWLWWPLGGRSGGAGLANGAQGARAARPQPRRVSASGSRVALWIWQRVCPSAASPAAARALLLALAAHRRLGSTVTHIGCVVGSGGRWAGIAAALHQPTLPGHQSGAASTPGGVSASGSRVALLAGGYPS